LREKQQQKVEATNKYDISDSDTTTASDDESVFGSVQLDKRQERIAIWWLHRGKRLSEMKRLIDGIIASNLEHTCDECGTNQKLTVEQFISIEDLVTEFDKKRRLGMDKMDKMHPVIGWRKFFQQTQLFRTLCADCLSNVALIRQHQAEQQLISDSDSNDESFAQMDYRYEQYAVQFDKTTSKNIAALWLQAARGRIMRENPPSIPSLSISHSHSSSSYSESVRMHLARAPNHDRVQIIRDDISSITDDETASSQQIAFYNDGEEQKEEANQYEISSDSSSSEEDVDVNKRKVRRNYDISSDDDSD